MTDSNRDNESPFQANNDAPRINADDAPLAPHAHDIGAELGAVGSHSAADDACVPNATEPVLEGKPQILSGGSSKDIVLQRLSSQTSWDGLDGAHDPHFGPASLGLRSTPDRRSLSMAAIVMIAAGIGAIGGGLASAGAGYFMSGESAKTAAADQGHAIEAAIAKLNIELAALKSNDTAQSGKIVERMDRIEKAQAEPAAKIAKLSEAIDKLRAPETTGSIASPSAPAPAVAPNRLPVVSGWVLRDVGEGAARVEGRLGIYEVYPGDPLPGLGSVDAIRKQDGRWVVVTSRGLIVAR